MYEWNSCVYVCVRERESVCLFVGFVYFLRGGAEGGKRYAVRKEGETTRERERK